jgi:hypothetical protein
MTSLPLAFIYLGQKPIAGFKLASLEQGVTGMCAVHGK